jgi:chromosome segregation ATPase
MKIHKYFVLYCILYYNTQYKIQLFNTISHTMEYKKMAITRRQILETASKLAEQGIKPTQTNVRESLGGGSFTTISEVLREWRQEQDQTAQLSQVVIPNDITDKTNLLIAQVWETAQNLANDRLLKEREALEHKEALINAEIDEANKVIETLENEQAELTNQLDTLNNDNSLLNTKNNELENLTNSLQTQLQAEKDRADQATNQATGLQAKLDEQNAKIERLTADLATATANATQATKNAQEHAQRADQATAELKTLTIENAKLIGKSDTLAEQLAKSEALTATQAEQINKLTAQVAKLEQIEKENAELKRMIENNRKVDDKQQSLLDQPEATPAKSRKNQKPQNNDN